MRTCSADPTEPGSRESPAALLTEYVLWWGGMLLLAVSIWLAFRRFQGSFSRPPAIGLTLLVGTMLGSVLAATAGWARRVPRGSRVPPACLTLSGLLLGAAVWVPEASPVASFTLWLLVAGGAVWSFCRHARVEEKRPLCEEGKHPLGALTPSCEDDESEEGLLPAEVLQRMVRAQDEQGAAVIYGTVRCHFAAGQRLQSTHFAFCPPLAQVAQFTADQLAGPSVRIKTSILETFGAGLELKLATPSREATDVQIQFFVFEREPVGGD